PAEPRHADPPPARLVDADDLVPDDERELRVRKLAVDDVQVGPADPAGADANKELAGRGLRPGELAGDEPRTRRLEDHRPHQSRVSQLALARWTSPRPASSRRWSSARGSGRWSSTSGPTGAGRATRSRPCWSARSRRATGRS